MHCFLIKCKQGGFRLNGFFNQNGTISETLLLSSVIKSSIIMLSKPGKEDSLNQILHFQVHSTHAIIPSSAFKASSHRQIHQMLGSFVDSSSKVSQYFKRAKSNSQLSKQEIPSFGLIIQTSNFSIDVCPHKNIIVIYKLEKTVFLLDLDLRDVSLFFKVGSDSDVSHEIRFVANSRDPKGNLISEDLKSTPEFFLPQSLPSIFGFASYKVHASYAGDSEAFDIKRLKPKRRSILVSPRFERNKISSAPQNINGVLLFSKMKNKIDDGVLNRLLQFQSALSTEIFELSKILTSVFEKYQKQENSAPEWITDIKSAIQLKIIFEGILLQCSTTLRKSPEITIRTDKFSLEIINKPLDALSRNDVFSEDYPANLNLFSENMHENSKSNQVSFNAFLPDFRILMSSRNYSEEESHVLNLRTSLSIKSDIAGGFASKSLMTSLSIEIGTTNMAVNPGARSCIMQIQKKYVSAYKKMKQAMVELREDQKVQLESAMEAISSLHVKETLNQARSKVIFSLSLAILIFF